MKCFLAGLSLVVIAGCAGNVSAPKPAKNVILFIGDGMGVSTVTAARIFDGQSRGETGEENLLSFERFPRTAMVKTYNTDRQVPDSAGTATAMHTGYKTRAGVINIGPGAHRQNCEESLQHQLEPFGVRIRKRDMALGIVTTTRLTHATPAAVYANSPERDWESNEFMTDAHSAAGCRDMAQQLVDFGNDHGFDLVMGGGAREFYGSDNGGRRQVASDDLVAQWLDGADNRVVIRDRDGLSSIAPDQQVLGLFAESHMTYLGRKTEDSKEPTLPEMVAAAIDHMAAQGADGYYLMIEGGRIDHGHHDGYPGFAMLETQAFADAVAVALEMIDLDETMVLVTADHSHVFTMGGYAKRGNPILGLVVGVDDTGRPKPGPEIAADGMPYTTLLYANGPGAKVNEPRGMPETGVQAFAQAFIPRRGTNADGTISKSETHGGEDVTLYGIGNGSDCIAGVIEQNLIYDFITAAYGWRAPVCED